jgi:hypothetical protein
MHPDTFSVRLTGKVWTIDSWDGESFTVTMKDQFGEVLVEKIFEGVNNQQSETGTSGLACQDTAPVDGWKDGYHNIDLEADYSPDNGDVTVTITNTLD